MRKFIKLYSEVWDKDATNHHKTSEPLLGLSAPNSAAQSDMRMSQPQKANRKTSAHVNVYKCIILRERMGLEMMGNKDFLETHMQLNS